MFIYHVNYNNYKEDHEHHIVSISFHSGAQLYYLFLYHYVQEWLYPKQCWSYLFIALKKGASEVDRYQSYYLMALILKINYFLNVKLIVLNYFIQSLNLFLNLNFLLFFKFSQRLRRFIPKIEKWFFLPNKKLGFELLENTALINIRVM